jgi:hypothetical protein
LSETFNLAWNKSPEEQLQEVYREDIKQPLSLSVRQSEVSTFFVSQTKPQETKTQVDAEAVSKSDSESEQL